MTGCDKDGNAWIDAPETLHARLAIHYRHGHIEHYQINPAPVFSMLPVHINGLLAIGCFTHLISRCGQDFFSDLPQLRFIIND